MSDAKSPVTPRRPRETGPDQRPALRCRWCLDALTAERSSRAYCSDRCRKAAYRARRRAEREAGELARVRGELAASRAERARLESRLVQVHARADRYVEEAHQHLRTVMDAVDQTVQDARADAVKGEDRRVQDARTEAWHLGWLAGAEAISQAWGAKLSAEERATVLAEAESNGLPHSLRSLAIEQPGRDALGLSTDTDRTNDHA